MIKIKVIVMAGSQKYVGPRAMTTTGGYLNPCIVVTSCSWKMYQRIGNTIFSNEANTCFTLKMILHTKNVSSNQPDEKWCRMTLELKNCLNSNFIGVPAYNKMSYF